MTELRTVLIVPDTHVPYHDKRAFGLMLDVAHAIEPDIIIVQGDFADCFAVSSHDRAPDRRHALIKEIEAVRDALDLLDDIGAGTKLYIAGNHEHRLERYLTTKAPELFGLVDIPGLLDLAERGWTWVPYRHDRRVGKAWFTHDIGTAGRTAIWRTLDLYQSTILTGHTHRVAYAVEGNARGRPHVAASFGWLGDVRKIDYAHRARVARDWALGFGIGYLEADGTMHVTPVPILRGRCVVAGQLFGGD